ncbi:MAG: S-layer homology domain-containing protein [Candidatus Altimarinota bacterium]
MKKIISPLIVLILLLNSFSATAVFAQEAGDDSDLPPTVIEVDTSSETTVTTTEDDSSTEIMEVTSTSSSLFTDISVSHPNYNAILLLKNEGVLQGYPDGSFKPDQPINRVEALKLIMEIADINNGQVASAQFSDTENNAWYSGYLNRAVYQEIVAGYPDGTFKPSQTVNLVEFLKILINSEEFDLSILNLNQIPYADAIPGQWYFKYLVFSKKHNLVSVDSDNKIFPDQAITRAKAAEIIFRVKKLTLEQAPRIESSDDGNNGNPITPEAPNLGDSMALFVSESYKFAIQYPELWFYATTTNSNSAAIRSYGFGPDDLEENSAAVNLELLPLSTEITNSEGLAYQKDYIEGKIQLTFKPANAKRVYRLIGGAEQESVLVKMLESLTEDVEGMQSYNPSESTTDDQSASTETETTTP